jgi:hypothetical protein
MKRSLTAPPALQVPYFKQLGEADFGPQGLRLPRIRRILLLLHFFQHRRTISYKCRRIRGSGVLLPGSVVFCWQVR